MRVQLYEYIVQVEYMYLSIRVQVYEYKTIGILEYEYKSIGMGVYDYKQIRSIRNKCLHLSYKVFNGYLYI